ncbi:MAG TPA: hypothetical protein VNL77_23960, partial [Roseiflexaceae bacterium]|nr:hypothetical protein [Roseiflexaceae bacterium]
AGALIYGIVRRISPAHAPAALLAWLWSPLQLIATALGAHNDSLLLPLLLVALSLAQRQRWLPALLVLALATHVKLTALLLAPPLLIWMARRAGLWRASAAALLALAMSAPLSWLLYAPLGGWETLPRMLHERGLYLAGSPANVLYRWLYDRQGWGAPQARTAATGGATLLFGLAALAPLGRLWRSAEHAPGDEPLWRAALGVTLAYLLLGCFWFQHWYLLWALAPAALLPHGAAARTLLPWYGFGALSANVAENMLGALPGLAPGRLELAAVVVAITFMPLACAAAVLAVRWRHAVRSTHTPEAARLAAPRGRRRRHRRIARRRRSRVWGGSGW